VTNYWASALLAVLAARESMWANGRVSVSVALAFAPLTTLATLLHLDLFHLDSFFGWFWVVAYGIYPAQLAFFLRRQLRAPGADPPRTRPLPVSVRVILAAHALVLVPLGVGLFLVPATFDRLWPWPIPPLSARAMAAWLLAFGVLAGHSLVENDWARVRAGMLGYPVLGALHVLMLVRFGEVVDRDHPGAWVYVGFVASCFVLGAFALATLSRSVPRAAARRPIARRRS
jgi:hypothetical protein